MRETLLIRDDWRDSDLYAILEQRRCEKARATPELRVTELPVRGQVGSCCAPWSQCPPVSEPGHRPLLDAS